ncbi:hypothetical protein UT300010_18010 [Clostridium perfringens]
MDYNKYGISRYNIIFVDFMLFELFILSDILLFKTKFILLIIIGKIIVKFKEKYQLIN